jgi:hypothetical protein
MKWDLFKSIRKRRLNIGAARPIERPPNQAADPIASRLSLGPHSQRLATNNASEMESTDYLSSPAGTADHRSRPQRSRWASAIDAEV